MFVGSLISFRLFLDGRQHEQCQRKEEEHKQETLLERMLETETDLEEM